MISQLFCHKLHAFDMMKQCKNRPFFEFSYFIWFRNMKNFYTVLIYKEFTCLLIIVSETLESETIFRVVRMYNSPKPCILSIF